VIPFFAFPPAVRRVIYTTNAIESINARLRKIIKTRQQPQRLHGPIVHGRNAQRVLLSVALRDIHAP
jgi:hypothetical protein